VVQRFTRLLAEAARPCRRAVTDRCSDETYVKVAGRWRYAHRVIGHFGHVIDVLVSRGATPPQPDGSSSKPSPGSR
jgi:IS6 family transposase